MFAYILCTLVFAAASEVEPALESMLNHRLQQEMKLLDSKPTNLTQLEGKSEVLILLLSSYYPIRFF